MSRKRWTMVVLAAVTALLLVAPTVAGENYKGFERGESLITVQELKTMMDANDPKLVVLGVARVDDFTMGHIPDSYGFWRGAYTAASGGAYPFGGMRMDQAAFQKFARERGIDDDSKVVIYDEKYDATRVWWMFMLYGKTDVRVLDGGYPAWKEAGYEIDRFGGLKVGKKNGNFTAKAPLEGWVATTEDVIKAKDDDSYKLWDTREPAEWDGSKKKKGAFRAGRIGWAKFLSWKDFRDKVGGKPTLFKSAADIQKVFDKNGMKKGDAQIFYCQSGVRTTTHLFSLYLMGWDIKDLKNYDGSWIEWSFLSQKDPSTYPVVGP